MPWKETTTMEQKVEFIFSKATSNLLGAKPDHN
jgi:hypothetical protein